MRQKIHLYTDTADQNLIKELLFDFDVHNINDELLNDDSFKNNNVLFLINKEIKTTIHKSFFLYNNVVVFVSTKEKNLDESKYGQTNFFYGPIKVKQFIDAIKAYFLFKTIIYKDVKILGEKMTNLDSGSGCMLTLLENKILTEFVEQKKIKREYFLEKILKINKNIETKTIESHLTRIRKKLLKVKSEIKISSKDDVFYIND